MVQIPLPEELVARIQALRKRAAIELIYKIIVIWSTKGGVGKTFLATELAWLLNAVLTDLDWDEGNATVALGYHHEKYMRVPLLDAFATGRTPTPKSLSRRPLLIPGHPEFGTDHPSSDTITKALIQWNQDLKMPLVVDNHPGAGIVQFGALGAADLIVSPVKLATRELDAMKAQLKEFGHFPTLLIPNLVPDVNLEVEIRALKEMCAANDVPIGPLVSDHTGKVARRRVRTCVTASPAPSKRMTLVVFELVRLAERVIDHVVAA